MTLVGATGGVPPTAIDQAHAKLRAAASELEGMFLQQLFEAMRQTVPNGGMGGDSTAGTMFTGMLDEELALRATEHSQTGLGEALYRRLNRTLPPPEGS